MPYRFRDIDTLSNWIAARIRLRVPWTHSYPIAIGPEVWSFQPKKIKNLITAVRRDTSGHVHVLAWRKDNGQLITPNLIKF
jgi:hypothetical protein